MELGKLNQYLAQYWDNEILPTLTEYVKIPCESPAFDKNWSASGHMEQAIQLAYNWVAGQQVPGCKLEILRDGERTPVLFAEIEATSEGDGGKSVLIYGHLDKQPPMTGWREGLSAWNPVLDEQGRLYGRGGADDGYSVFAAVAAIKALKESGTPHARMVLLIECSEESGSPDLPAYLKKYSDRFGNIDLVVALDSGCGNYDQLWSTTSLRGLLEVTLQIDVLAEGVHSGIAGGITPSPFTIARQLLDRVEDTRTGKVIVPELMGDIPSARVEQAGVAAQVLGGEITSQFPFLEGVQPLDDNYTELLLNNSWRPSLAITAQEGIPKLGEGGNVVHPSLKLKLSFRLPPNVIPSAAGEAVKQRLLAEPPFGAKVQVTAGGMQGWDAPPLAGWLEEATNKASLEVFGQEACYFGLGGTIPFMQMIGEQFPEAQFLITGVLGPHSNAHGPNEFLHVPYAKKLTACLNRILSEHQQQR